MLEEGGRRITVGCTRLHGRVRIETVVMASWPPTAGRCTRLHGRVRIETSTSQTASPRRRSCTRRHGRVRIETSASLQFAQAAFSASCSCHASISDRLQAIALEVIRSGGGNAPALTSRHIVVLLIPSSRSTSFTLNSCIVRTSPVNRPVRAVCLQSHNRTTRQ